MDFSTFLNRVNYGQYSFSKCGGNSTALRLIQRFKRDGYEGFYCLLLNGLVSGLSTNVDSLKDHARLLDDGHKRFSGGQGSGVSIKSVRF